MRKILHVDMNSFFASCEQANNKLLKQKPLIVAGDPGNRHGIVLAACYKAKAYGVKTTMPVWQAKELCKEAIFVKPNFSLYSHASREIMDIFDRYTPLKEQLSIDEAFLDMTGTDEIFGSISKVAIEIQEKIKEELDIPCSIGISNNKLLAKMASDFKKPMGITHIYQNEVKEKLWNLDIRQLYGVGKVSCRKLKRVGINTIGDLAKSDLLELNQIVGCNYGILLHNYANGIDESKVKIRKSDDMKSISNEITFHKDIEEINYIKQEMMVIADSVAWRMRKKSFKTRTVSIKIKFDDFSVITRSKTSDNSTNSTDTIYKIALNLILDNINNKAIRLLGISVSNFVDSQENIQTNLFEEQNVFQSKKDKMDEVTDKLREKFGYGSIKRAIVIEGKKIQKNQDL